MYINFESIYSLISAVKQTSETLQEINSSGTFVLLLLSSFTVAAVSLSFCAGGQSQVFQPGIFSFSYERK